MPEPEVSLLARDFYNALGFHRDADGEYDYALLKFCAAWVSTIDPVYLLAREGDDGEPPWSLLFDVENCPSESLPYLAQYVGCVLTPEMDEAQQRSEIAEPTGWKRGWHDSIETVAQRSLTGTKKVILRPRTPEVGEYYARTMLSETPDPSRVERDLRAAVPAWSLLDYEAFDGYTYADLDAGFETYAAVDAEFDSYGEILEAEL